MLAAAHETLALDLHAPNEPPPSFRARTPALRYWTPPLVGENQVEFEVQALRIGDVALVGGAGEVFIELAQAVQERSPFDHTMYLGYANGDIGYIPTVAAYAEGRLRGRDRPLSLQSPRRRSPGQRRTGGGHKRGALGIYS